MTHLQQLNVLRSQIDELDSKIVRLLNERAALAIEIGKMKQEHGTAVHSPVRELQVLEHVARGNGGPLSNEALRRIYEALMQECRQIEHDLILRAGSNEPERSEDKG